MNKIPSSFYTVRFSDCDPFGHLNNARYIDYFLNAREDHLTNVYNRPLAGFYKQGLSWLVGSHEIKYLRPAQYSEIVFIQTSLLRVTENALLVEMMMMDEAQMHLKSLLWTKFIPVNVKTGKKENHPSAFMDFAKAVERTEVADFTDINHRLAHITAGLKNKALSGDV